MNNIDIKWHDISEWGAEGKGWDDTNAPYDRLPGKAEELVTPEVWSHSHSSIGICSHFNTDSTAIYAQWSLDSDELGEDNFNVCGFSGVDLYSFDDSSNTWRWAAAPPHFCIKDKTPSTVIIADLPKEMRRYRLYLPLRNPALKVEIGVETDAIFQPITPRTDKPLVYYGTSIAHGAFAARAGLGCPQVLGRRLDLPLINLGFSGSARMEPDLAELIAELDARIFVLDALPNMDENLVRTRAETFISTICKAHPETPVVLVEDHPKMTSWLKPEQQHEHESKWQAFKEVYQKLLNSGFKKLYYVEGNKLFGTDNEASMDGVHPSDLGYMRMADIMEKAMQNALTD